MKSHVVGALLAFAACLSTPLVALQLQADSTTVEGSIVSAGETSLVIAANDGTTRTFVIDADTTLPVGELAPGTPVAVRYQNLDGDRALALSVGLLDPAAQSPASTTGPSGGETPPAGPEDTPITLLGVATLGLVVAFVFVWVFGRQRRREVPHLSL